LSLTTDEDENPRIIKDIWDAILGDDWIYGIVWGKPRTGKTTLKMDLGFNVYKDWDQVLQSIIFNLSGLLYRMEKGEPCRILTRNLLHNRVPYLILDDWGANANKAKTQHEPAWDLVKGAWDTYATKIGTVFASMNTPDEITLQLQNKYTHELYLPAKGTAKYDCVDWEQNFRGWQPRQDKHWIQTFYFPPAPSDVYKEYDENRMSLVDELNVLIRDKIAETETDRTIKRMNNDDINLLEIVQQRGLLPYTFFRDSENTHLKDALIRCKARSLLLAVRKNQNYSYDLTDMGLEILNAIHLQTADKDQLKKDLKAHD
jgi:hypothetical protein